MSEAPLYGKTYEPTRHFGDTPAAGAPRACTSRGGFFGEGGLGVVRMPIESLYSLQVQRDHAPSSPEGGGGQVMSDTESSLPSPPPLNLRLVSTTRTPSPLLHSTTDCRAERAL